MSDFLVKCDDLRECRVAKSEVRELEPGQALLRVETFGLTANNITYAVLGEMMSYWDFFPAEDGWGRVPMWGFAEVEQSAAEGVEPGMRLYGYLPPSSKLVVTPAGPNERGFADGSPLTHESVSASLRTINPAWHVAAGSDSIAIQVDPRNVDLPAVLALVRNSIVRREGGKLAGTGPFTVSEWLPGKRLALTARDDYWNGRAFLSSIDIDLGGN